MWLKLFGMDANWTVGVRVNTSASDCTDEKHTEEIAFVCVDSGYFHATIELNAYNLDPDDDVDQFVLHEFVHIILWPLSMSAEADAGRFLDVVVAQKEEATELFARVLIRIFRHAMTSGKKRNVLKSR